MKQAYSDEASNKRTKNLDSEADMYTRSFSEWETTMDGNFFFKLYVYWRGKSVASNQEQCIFQKYFFRTLTGERLLSRQEECRRERQDLAEQKVRGCFG